MHIRLPEPNRILPFSRPISPAPGPAHLFPDEVEVDGEDLPIVSVSSTFSRELEEITELVGEESHHHTSYQKEKGLYLAGYKPSCTIIGLARNSQDALIEIPFQTIDNLTLVGPLVRQQMPYSIFLIDAPYQATLSCVDIIVREAAYNRHYCNHKPLVSVVEKGMEKLLPELVQRYAETPFCFIKAEKYGSDVIDVQLFGQPRY